MLSLLCANAEHNYHSQLIMLPVSISFIFYYANLDSNPWNDHPSIILKVTVFKMVAFFQHLLPLQEGHVSPFWQFKIESCGVFVERCVSGTNTIPTVVESLGTSLGSSKISETLEKVSVTKNCNQSCPVSVSTTRNLQKCF